MTNEEKEWLRKNVSFGRAGKDEFPGLKDGETIPFMAVPNMPQPDGTVRKFELDEVLEALRGGKEK